MVMISNLLNLATTFYSNWQSDHSNVATKSVELPPDYSVYYIWGILIIAVIIVIGFTIAYWIRAWFVQSSIFRLDSNIEDIKQMLLNNLKQKYNYDNNLGLEEKTIDEKYSDGEARTRESLHFFENFKKSILSLRHPSKLLMYTLSIVIILFVVGMIIINFI